MAQSIENHARDLVIRARAGDQLAVAMIGEVALSAKNGSARAQKSSKAIARYIDHNPTAKAGATGPMIGAEVVGALSALQHITRRAKANEGRFGHEAHESTCLLLVTLPMVGGERAMRVGSTILSDGPLLTPQRIGGISGSLRDPAFQDYFMTGVNDGRGRIDLDNLDRIVRPFVAAGQTLGAARLVQIVRRPAAPLSVLDPMVAWELGQDEHGNPLPLINCVDRGRRFVREQRNGIRQLH